MKKIFLLFILITSVSYTQSFEYLESIGHFNMTSSFYVTPNGLFYITDTANDEIYLLDTLGNLTKTFGGYGWSENSFDDPMDVFADPLAVYVADKNNHRIKRFDKNLNYISSLYKRESDDPQVNFGYPLSCATSNQGELYLIDSENKRALKFDFNGNFQQNFGGFDAGEFMLNNPLQLAIASNNNIFIIDEDNILVFDQYGNGIHKINCGEKLNSIRIIFNNLTVTSDDKVFYSSLNSDEKRISILTLNGVDEIPDIVSSILFNNKLYLLTNDSIMIFNKTTTD
ncbi:MAG: NHL repeat-containing protein [Ignavibacteriaceae bacterium]